MGAMTPPPERFALARGVGPAEPTALASLRRGIDGAGGGGTAAERVSVTSRETNVKNIAWGARGRAT